MARFCLATSIAPSEYKRLTLRERSAFLEAHRLIHGGD